MKIYAVKYIFNIDEARLLSKNILTDIMFTAKKKRL